MLIWQWNVQSNKLASIEKAGLWHWYCYIVTLFAILMNVSAKNDIWCSHWSKQWNVPHIVPSHWQYRCKVNVLFTQQLCSLHDDVIKWKHFPRYCPSVPIIRRYPVNFPHKDQWRGAFIFSLICSWINGWVNNSEAGDLRGHCAHYDVTVMECENILATGQLSEPKSHYFVNILWKQAVKVYSRGCSLTLMIGCMLEIVLEIINE